MGMDPEAKLFYGYVHPTPDERAWSDEGKEDDDDSDDEEADDAWAVYGVSNGCETGIYGYDDDMGRYLAVKESLHRVEWSSHELISQADLTPKPEWDEQLRAAAALWNLDISKLKLGWHLVALYF